MRRLARVLAATFIAATCVMAIDPSPPGHLAGFITVGRSPGYIRHWLETPSDRAPTLPRAAEFAVGETAYIAFIFTGAQPDEAGNASVDVDIRIGRPDGSELFFKKAYAAARHSLPESPGFVMADPALDLGFDSSDQMGTYSVTAIFHDHIANKGAIAEVHVRLVKRKA